MTKGLLVMRLCRRGSGTDRHANQRGKTKGGHLERYKMTSDLPRTQCVGNPG